MYYRDILISTGGVPGNYEILDVVFAMDAQEQGFFKNLLERGTGVHLGANPGKAFEKVKAQLQEQCYQLKGNAVIFCQFEHRVAAGQGIFGAQQIVEIFAYGTAVLMEGRRKRCQACSEYVSLEALVCKHCGMEFPKPEVPPEPAEIPYVEPTPKEIVSTRIGQAYHLQRVGKTKEAIDVYIAITEEFPDEIDGWRCLVSVPGVNEECKARARKEVERLREGIRQR